MPRTKLIGFAPDADPTTPGVITSCDSCIPTHRGMKGAPTRVAVSIAALAAECVGAAVLRALDNSTSLFAGTATALYKANGATWDTVTRTAGVYAVPAIYHWSFAQFGNTSLAVNKADTLQYYPVLGLFKDVAGAPKAAMVETVGQFVFLCDTNEATYGDQSDRWWCSPSGGFADWSLADWTPSVTTECATGRLVSSPGPIMGVKRFGSQIIIYKARSMYIGTYVGAPEIWRFEEVPAQIGAVSERAIANIGTDAYPRHIFMGVDDIYVFDGSRPQPLGIGYVKDYVYDSIIAARLRQCIAVHDSKNDAVIFSYPSTDTSYNGNNVVYNYRSKKWGVGITENSECLFEYNNLGLTYDNLTGLTYDQLTNPTYSTYEASFLSADSPSVGDFGTTHQLYAQTGASTNSLFGMGDMGDEEQFSLLTRVRPLFLQAPTSATLNNYWKNTLGDSYTADEASTYSDGKFDCLMSARWHNLQFAFEGDWEMAELNVYAQPEGTE